MKNSIVILILIFFIFAGCASTETLPIKPEIVSAEYQIVTQGEFERGYNVFVEIAPLGGLSMVKGIVLNRHYFPVEETVDIESRNSIIDQYLPVQSRLLQNFRGAATDNRKDGIVFEIDGKEYYYKTEFKLK